jgi:hypothetical protein
MQILQILALH